MTRCPLEHFVRKESKVPHSLYTTTNISLVKESSLESYARVILIENKILGRIETNIGSPLRVQYKGEVKLVQFEAPNESHSSC